MPAPTPSTISPPTRDELLAFRRDSFRVYLVLCLVLVSVGFLLRRFDIPRPFGVLMGTWLAAVHFFQPPYPGARHASTGVRLARSLALGTLLGALAHWIVVG